MLKKLEKFLKKSKIHLKNTISTNASKKGAKEAYNRIKALP